MGEVWKKWCRLCAGEENLVVFNRNGKDLFSHVGQCLSLQINEDEYPTLLCEVCINKLLAFNEFAKKCEKVQLLYSAIITENRHQSEEFYTNLRDEYLMKCEVKSERIIEANPIKIEVEDIKEDADALQFDNDDNDALQFDNDDSFMANAEDCAVKIDDFYDESAEYDTKHLSSNKKDVKEKKIKKEKVTANKPKKSRKCEKGTSYKKLVPYKVDNDAVECDQCGVSFPLHTDLIRHMVIHYPNFVCDYCAKVFDSKFKLRTHVLTHTATKYECNVCGKFQKGKVNLAKHIKRHFKDAYKCLYCPERFKSYSLRMKHLTDIHGELPKQYKCDQCDKKFKELGFLNKHIKKIHLKELHHACTTCEEKFFTPRELRMHVIIKHSQERNYHCTICEKSFKMKNTLDEHLRMHANDRRYICSYCGLSFIQRGTLNGHIKSIHENPKPKPEKKPPKPRKKSDKKTPRKPGAKPIRKRAKKTQPNNISLLSSENLVYFV